MPNSNDDQRYGSVVAFIFIFNIIVGTGALALPRAFSDAGWLISTIIVALICMSSFISLTFVIESMSIANYLSKSSTCLLQSREPNENSDDERAEINERTIDGASLSSSNSQNIESTPLINCNSDLNSEQSLRDDSHLFDITEQMELGHLAKLFFKKEYLKYFYICIIIYLYGDLCIYRKLATISKSIRDVACSYDNCTKTMLDSDDLCWPEGHSMNASRGFMYRSYIIILSIFLQMINLHGKRIQFWTTVFRWFALTSMIGLASVTLIEGKGEGSPTKSNLNKIPNLFGISVYSFMCHHSVTRILTPIKDKSKIYRLLTLDYVLILLFYILLSLTGVFTFEIVEDVYTLNFQKPRCTNLTSIHQSNVPRSPILETYLPLFPVFTLSTNFPILALTLSNNLKALLFKETTSNSSETIFVKYFIKFIVFLPPTLIAFFSENVELFVGITGSYGGTMIQYVIPLFLVYCARKSLNEIENDQDQLSIRSNENSDLNNSFSSSLTVPRRILNKTIFLERFQSFFKSNYWIYFIFLWTIFCLICVTIDHFMFWFDIEI